MAQLAGLMLQCEGPFSRATYKGEMASTALAGHYLREREPLVLQVGGWAWCYPLKIIQVTKPESSIRIRTDFRKRHVLRKKKYY